MADKESIRDRALNWLRAFIPRRVSNAAVAGVLNFMRRCQRLFKRDYSEQLHRNEEAFLKHADAIRASNGYVEDQNSYTDMTYGKSTMQYSGCEVFAVYNAVFDVMGEALIPLPRMIAEFERDGMVLGGKFGTAPKAIKDYMDRHGFRTEFSTREREFEAIAERCQSLILTMYNDRNNIMREVHTVCISKAGGKYTAHNVYCNGRVVGPCDSLQGLLSEMNGGRVKGISLIGVSAGDGRVKRA